MKSYWRWPTRICWKFWIAPIQWSEKWFGFQYAPDQISGILYAGVTVLGISIIYSDHW